MNTCPKLYKIVILWKSIFIMDLEYYLVLLLPCLLLPCCLAPCLCLYYIFIFRIYILYLEFITYRLQDPGSPLLVAEKHRQANLTNTSPWIEDIESPRIKGIQAPLWLSSQQATFGGCIRMLIHSYSLIRIIKWYYLPHRVLYSVWSM